MKAAFLIYTFLLLLEGALAWLLTGQGFLPFAVSVGLLVYSTVRHTSRPVAEGVRLFTAAALTVAGPLQYQAELIPLLLCFIAIPHFLAATQALAEQRQDAGPQTHPGMRSLVFTVAFYTSMGLAFLLSRGLEPTLSGLTTGVLSVVVLLVALPAWEASRIPRLRSAPPSSALSPRRWLMPAILLAVLGILYSGALPPAANVLCRLSPHWRMDPVEFKNKPPKTPPSTLAAKISDQATKLGLDASASTGEHSLPPRSDLQPGEGARLYVKLEDPSLTPTLLAKSPLYVRSHTLNRFSDNKWSAEVSGGVWLTDAADGMTDGIVTLVPQPTAPLIRHEVYAVNADGYTLPAIAGLTAIHMPRVYAVPGDVLQTPGTGNIRYRADSALLLYQNLPTPALLESAPPEGKEHLAKAGGELGIQLQRLGNSLFKDSTLLSDRVDALRDFFAEHYQYSTVMKNPHSLGPLENFLFDERRGHCDFYASAAALLLREAGIPSRIAYGFATTEVDAESGLFTVRDRHAHAWTEIYLKGLGWTICDFTPSENIGQPEGTPANPPPSPAPDLKAFADAARDVPPPPELAKKVQEIPFFTRLMNWFKQQPWFAPSLQYGPWVLLAAAAGFALIRLFKNRTLDPEAAEAKARALREQQPAYFLEFLRLSTAAGYPKPDGTTPLEHFHALHKAGLPVPPLRPLISYHCATRYEDVPRDPDREKSFAEDLKAFASAVMPTRA